MMALNLKEDSSDGWCLVPLYGNEVTDFSSQYGAQSRMSYSAHNLAGASNIYPKYGDFTQACVFRTYGRWWKVVSSATKPYLKMPRPTSLNSEDFIEVLFDQRLYPVAIQIYETYNPGAIVRIMVCDHQAGTSVDTGRQNKWMTVWSKPVEKTRPRPRIFSPPIKKVNTPINMVRLELNHSLLEYYTELDCIVLFGVKHRPTSDEHTAFAAKVERDRVPEFTDLQAGDNCQVGSSLQPSSQEEVPIKEMESLHLAEYPGPDEAQLEQPFETLPDEVIVMILSYLDLLSLCRLSQTCRLLQKHAYDSILYSELDLQSVWHLVSDETLTGLTERCVHLQRLNLSWCGKANRIQASVFQTFMKSCSETLTSLQMSCCPFVDKELLHIVSCTCHQLKDLDLSGCAEVDNMSSLAIMQMPQLQGLNLYRTKVDTYSMVCIIRCLPELRHLNIGSCSKMIRTKDIIEELGLRCPKLLSLDLWRARNMEDDSFIKFIRNCSLLEELDLGWCSELNSRRGSISSIALNCPNLKKLFLTANRSVCDDDLYKLAKLSKHLQQLDILGTREVSPSALEQVLTSCKELVFLDVSFCANIKDSDVAHFRAKFPDVSIKKSFQDGG